MSANSDAYQQYLKSDTWQTIRRQRLAIDNNECVLCGNKAEHVHHRRYPKKWGEETVSDLVSLCSDCHAKHHTENIIKDIDKERVKDACADIVARAVDLSEMLELDKESYEYVHELALLTKFAEIISITRNMIRDQVDLGIGWHWSKHHHEKTEVDK